MKIILSRKGFDSCYGGAPSPIFQDKSIVSLPIPETSYSKSGFRYKDIKSKDNVIVKVIESLNLPVNNDIISVSPDAPKDRLNGEHLAHLDPDLVYSSRDREKGWRGLLGQDQAAMGHLINQEVGANDLFLFYGYYQKMDIADGSYRIVPKSQPIHLIWGWLQVEACVKVVDIEAGRYPQYSWTKYHPHFHHNAKPCSNNSIFIAKEYLEIDGLPNNSVSGYGAFNKYHKTRQLTDPDDTNPNHLRSYWRLPECLHTGEQCPLSYNHKREWTKSGGYARLKSYPRAQEYVMDCTNVPGAVDWVRDLIASNRN